jgi:cellulose synthase/poly-beta-1,6-N-acetylglucosamine synthase-like glycosyltransferase
VLFTEGIKDGPVSVYYRYNEVAVIHFLIAFSGVLLLVYAGLIFYYHRIWDRIPVPQGSLSALGANSPGDFFRLSGNTQVSVIIPARNEARRIGPCLEALSKQGYPRSNMEIIVVNDFSTDETAARVKEYSTICRLVNLSDHVSGRLNSYKKKAIETGIAESIGELIICTDADCTMGPDWISTLVESYEKNGFQFLAAPVKIFPAVGWLAVFQALDFISLQGITGAAVYNNLYPMCNGANLAYTRKAYEAVSGFRDIDHIASGDDMLLMKKIQAAFPKTSGYVKDPRAIVLTAPAENVQSFFNQRIRWASKVSHYRHEATFITLAWVYGVNGSLFLLFMGCLWYGHWQWLWILLVFKTISEYFFVAAVARFFDQQSLMKYFPLCQPFHILYTIIAGGFGSFGKYEWKNRKVK